MRLYKRFAKIYWNERNGELLKDYDNEIPNERIDGRAVKASVPVCDDRVPMRDKLDLCRASARVLPGRTPPT